MKKWLIITILLISIIAIYLNRSYSRIYERNDPNLKSPYIQNQMKISSNSKDILIKYISLGDSLSAGVGSSSIETTLPYIFAKILSKNNTVDFINLAISGATAKSLIQNQLTEAIVQNPDYITVFIGVNDIHDLTSKEDYADAIDFIINKISEKTKAKIILFNLPYLGTENNILPPYNTIIDLKTHEFNQVLEKVAKEKNLTLIDLYTPTKNIFSKNPDFYSIDEFHPSSKGYEMWGTLLDDKQY